MCLFLFECGVFRPRYPHRRFPHGGPSTFLLLGLVLHSGFRTRGNRSWQSKARNPCRIVVLTVVMLVPVAVFARDPCRVQVLIALPLCSVTVWRGLQYLCSQPFAAEMPEYDRIRRPYSSSAICWRTPQAVISCRILAEPDRGSRRGRPGNSFSGEFQILYRSTSAVSSV